MSSSYINQIDAAIGAVQPIAGQNITVTPNPTGGLIIALPPSITVPGTVTANQLAVITTGTTGLTFTNPVVATSGTPVINPPKITFNGSLWYGVGLTANPSTWSITPNGGVLNFTFSSATPLGGNAVVNIADRLQSGSIIAGQSQFNFQTGGAGSIFPITSVANSVGNLATYQVTIAPGGQVTNGQNVTITGFTNLTNNGTFVVFSSSTSTLTVFNLNAVAETHAGTATMQGTYFSQAGFDVVFSPSDTMPIFGTSRQIIGGFEGTPSQVQIALNAKADSVDAGYMRLINDGASGDHGMEIGGIYDGTGINPSTIQMGSFGGGSRVQIKNQPLSGLVYNLTAAATSFGSMYTVYTGTFSAPLTNQPVGGVSEEVLVTITGFTNLANNGSFKVAGTFATPITATSITANVLTVTAPLPDVGFIPGINVIISGTAEGFLNGQTVTVASVNPGVSFTANFTHGNYSNPSDTGTIALVAVTPTTLTVVNANGVAETHAAKATVSPTVTSGAVFIRGEGVGSYVTGGINSPALLNVCANPTSVNLVLTEEGNAVDSTNFNIFSDPNGNHGFEIASVYGNNSRTPSFLEMAFEGGGPFITLSLPDETTSLTMASDSFGASVTPSNNTISLQTFSGNGITINDAGQLAINAGTAGTSVISIENVGGLGAGGIQILDSTQNGISISEVYGPAAGNGIVLTNSSTGGITLSQQNGTTAALSLSNNGNGGIQITDTSTTGGVNISSARSVTISNSGNAGTSINDSGLTGMFLNATGVGGDVNINATNGGSVQLSATTGFINISGLHLVNSPANPDIHGHISSVSGTTVSYAYASAFSSTPTVVVTPTTNAGAFYLSASSNTGFTITYATSGAQTFNYWVIGNPT